MATSTNKIPASLIAAAFVDTPSPRSTPTPSSRASSPPRSPTRSYLDERAHDQVHNPSHSLDIDRDFGSGGPRNSFGPRESLADRQSQSILDVTALAVTPRLPPSPPLTVRSQEGLHDIVVDDTNEDAVEEGLVEEQPPDQDSQVEIGPTKGEASAAYEEVEPGAEEDITEEEHADLPQRLESQQNNQPRHPKARFEPLMSLGSSRLDGATDSIVSADADSGRNCLRPTDKSSFGQTKEFHILRQKGSVDDANKRSNGKPRSSYYIGPPGSNTAYGTPPVGQIGVHYPREIIRIERDYSLGELIQFSPTFPLELEGRITATQFIETVNSINEILISAHSLTWSTFDNVLATLTLYLSIIFLEKHYDKQMRRLAALLDSLNAELYNPQGLNILWPRQSAFLFLEIEYY